MRRLVRILTVLAGLAAVAFGAGFAGFVTAAHRPATTPPDSDGIVVLTGGAERVETGLRLLVAGRAKLLLISGVAGGAGLGELLHRAGLQEGPIDTRITLGRTATTTLGNAEETAEWVHTNRIHTLIVVTAGFHMPRAMLELGREIPQAVLYPVPVQPQPGQLRSMSYVSSLRVLGAEYLKLLAAWAGASRVVRQPVSFVSSHLVGKSVHG